MAVKGKQREQQEFKKELFTGFAAVRVVALNPSREELNKLVGKEDSVDDKPIEYVGKDNDGNTRVRMAFWLRDEVKEKLFVYSFNITNKERKNKNGDKVQVINATCGTTWTPYKEGSDEANGDLLPEWYKNFTNKEKENLGPKKWRKAISGEEELGNLIRTWLGRMNFQDPDTEVLIDTSRLLAGDYGEVRSLIEGDYDTPFVVLLGVKTDEDDNTKKYQQVWKKFLPNGFMKYIKNGMKFPSDYSKKVWKDFEDEVNGEYPFDCYHKLALMAEYDEADDLAGSKETKKPEPTSSDY